MYDVVIVDPYSDLDPNVYCNTRSQPFAYVSLGEVAINAPYRNQIMPSWIIGKNKAWNNSLVMDQTQKGWQDFFLDQLIEPLWNKGYRGFFFDTLDSYLLAVHDPKKQQEQIDSLVAIIKAVKQRHPDVRIILNRGFVLLPELHSDIYAVLIESLYHAWNQGVGKYELTSESERTQLFEQIAKIKAMNLPIIVVDYLPPDQKQLAPVLAKQLSDQGFIPWITDALLQSIYVKKFHEFNRKILIVYSHDTYYSIRYSPPVLLLGGLLEYMGYAPKYIDLTEEPKLPQGDLREEYAGVVLWLSSSKTNPNVFNWALKQMAYKIPVVFIESFGMELNPSTLGKLGLTSKEPEDTTQNLRIIKMHPKYMKGEVKPFLEPYDFNPVRSKNAQVILQLMNGKNQIEDAVAITSWGGYSLFPYDVLYLPNENAEWIINPLQFFHDALKLQDAPIADTTTENGRRMMSVHIDGDGFSFQAKWIGGKNAGVELRDKILKRFRIPTSLSVITGEIGPEGPYRNKSPEMMATAKSMFELPWVEIASHTFSHPFVWMPEDKKLFEYGENFFIKIPHYVFNESTEITGSVDFINKYLAPPGKKCRLFFWSGLGDPSVSALAIAKKDKLLNINGGSGANLTNNFPSVTRLGAKGIELGGYYQIFAPIDMDFNFMNGFLGPLYGFDKVIQTFKLTESPYRFRHIDIYYHIYAASMPASLETLIKVYQWALKQQVINIYISDYIKKMLDFYQLKMGKENDGWIIISKGDLHELRSNKPLGYPNFEKSQNIIGFNDNKDDRYIHMGPGRFTLLAYQKDQPTQPYLVEANAFVDSFSRDGKNLVIRFKGYMPLQFTLANVKNCTTTSKSELKSVPNEDNTITFSSNENQDEIHFNCG